MLNDTAIKQSIRRNAKHISLRINHKGEVIVTAPYKLSERKFNQLICAHQAWITKSLSYYTRQTQCILPEQIHLQAISKTWHIEYQKTNAHPKLMPLNDTSFIIFGAYDKNNAIQLLKRWITQQAKVHLYTWLKKISDEINLPYNSISIGHHRSQWGSCSQDKRISLNAKLLFLPPHLVEHILIHELAHTVHFDHSAQFWQLVASHDQCWRSHKQLLKDADSHLPSWIK